MPRRTPRAKAPVHEHLALQLTGWNARVAAGLNPDVWETRQHHDGMPVYEFGSSVELSAVCVGPPDRVHEAYRLSVGGSERPTGEFEHKLSAYQARGNQDELRVWSIPCLCAPAYEEFEPSVHTAKSDRYKGMLAQSRLADWRYRVF